jgi:hypothetical protein
MKRECSAHFTQFAIHPSGVVTLRAILGLAASALFQLCPVAQAGLTFDATTTAGFSLGLPADIPVNNTCGLVDKIDLTGTSISSITDVTLTLNFSGGWDGGFYAYLWHQTAGGHSSPVMDVLFDQIGVTGNSLGLSASGMNVTFIDTGTLGSIQSATGSAGLPLTGSYQPSSPLSAFNGMSGDGTWALFIADKSSAKVGTLESWSFTISGNVAAVPELPTSLAGLLALGLLGLAHALKSSTP